MEIFDTIDTAKLEQRELHLWVLALTVIVVMTLGLALMMYPAVFEHTVILNGSTMKNAFFGFCALAFLLVGYIIDRQIVIRQLRSRLAEDRSEMRKMRQQASTDMLATLPGIERFRDCLAMEYRRAFNTRQPVSLVTVALTPSLKIIDQSEVIMTQGDALKALSRKLRGEDSIYHFATGVFGIVLPGVGLAGAQSVVRRLADGLQDASGAESRFAFNIKITNYPDDVTTAREMEEAVKQALPETAGTGDQLMNEALLASR